MSDQGGLDLTEILCSIQQQICIVLTSHIMNLQNGNQLILFAQTDEICNLACCVLGILLTIGQYDPDCICTVSRNFLEGGLFVALPLVPGVSVVGTPHFKCVLVCIPQYCAIHIEPILRLNHLAAAGFLQLPAVQSNRTADGCSRWWT